MKPLQLDVFGREPEKLKPAPAPYQRSSATSRDAAEKVSEGPAFHGNRLACFKEIVRCNELGGTTRKRIAERFFAGKQNYTTGPVALLMEEGLVYEESARDRHGAIMTRPDGTIVPLRIDGSAVLKLTQKGKAAAKGAA